jgi:hypothetical protein
VTPWIHPMLPLHHHVLCIQLFGLIEHSVPHAPTSYFPLLHLSPTRTVTPV